LQRDRGKASGQALRRLSYRSAGRLQRSQLA
jgi:hypothetical protein